MARGAELPGVALCAEDREQILKGVSQPFGVIVGEIVDDLEERSQRLRVAVGKKGVVEDVSEQRRDARVLRHSGYGLGVQVQGLVPAYAGTRELGPAVLGELPGEESSLAPPFLALGIKVIHELVDESDGYLLDLALWVGHLAHEDVAGGVYAAFGVGVQHGFLYAANWFSET